MIEQYRGPRKRHKTNLISTEGQNSYKELIDKKVIKRKEKSGNQTVKTLKLLDYIEIKKEKKSKFSLGEINIAKIHREVIRPLKKLKDLTKEDIKNNSCPCCGLPLKINGKLEDYKMCDNPDEFSDCGEGVILYFSFFKFCIFVTFIATIGIGFFDSYISYNYYSELRKICDNEHYKKFII